MSRLRVGIVDYLNSRPLAWWFRRGRGADHFAVSYHTPAAVADLLAAGDLEVGLVPSIELQRIPGLAIIPGLCIASSHEVRSVLLVSRTPLPAVRRVAVDDSSRTSVALVRIVLAERYGIRPQFDPLPPDIDAMLAEHEAALLIGDPALAVDRARYRVLDLAAEWRALTGLPFVFAVWVVREGIATDGLAGAFHDSLALGLACLDEVVRESAAELGLAPDEVRRYLSRHLSFTLGEAERRALEEFFARAARHGLIPAVRPLRFLAGS